LDEGKISGDILGRIVDKIAQGGLAMDHLTRLLAALEHGAEPQNILIQELDWAKSDSAHAVD